MARIYEFTAEEKNVAGLTEDQFKLYLSSRVRDGAMSLEECFQEHLFHDTVASGEDFITTGGEVWSPAGMWAPSFSSFIDWAVSEGLLVVTDKARALPDGFAIGGEFQDAAE